jgi:hypothetical protein
MPSWAGLWDNIHAQPYALLNEPNSTLRTIARAMAPQGVRHWGRLADMLTGSTIPSARTRDNRTSQAPTSRWLEHGRFSACSADCGDQQKYNCCG